MNPNEAISSGSGPSAGFDAGALAERLSGIDWIALLSNPLNAFLAVSLAVGAVWFLFALTQRKFLGYVARNATRNRVRTVLTILSTAICLFLMETILAFIEVQNRSVASLEPYNRIVSMSSQGFSKPLPIALVQEVRDLEEFGVRAVTQYSWYGGKLGEETLPFAQFGVDPENFFKVYPELKIPEEQEKAWIADRAGCVIGRKMAEERGYKIGDKIPLAGTIYQFDLDLNVSGIYEAPPGQSERVLFFNWYYLDEGLRKTPGARAAGNAGVIVAKCADSRSMPDLCVKIDGMTAASDSPTKTQTEQAFASQFVEMWGDLPGIIRNIGLAVLFTLVCVGGNTMAMAMRERTTEIAVLKAIGFGKGRVFFLVMLEAVAVTLAGGALGALGAKLLFEAVDISRFSGGFLDAFYIPWNLALLGVAASLWIGILSGIMPALRSSNLPIIQGLRRVG